MTTSWPVEYLPDLVRELCNLPRETDWVEFKVNNYNPQEIEEYVSALANSATLSGKAFAYLVWGVSDEEHEIVGTKFDPAVTKVGNEELEIWLLKMIDPKINFRFGKISVDGFSVVVLEIPRAFNHPVRFQGQEYIRSGSYKKKLKDFPEKEKELWRTFDKTPFEDRIAFERVRDDEALRLLDYPAYFELLDLPLPDNRGRILDALAKDRMIHRNNVGDWKVTNLALALFAPRRLSNMDRMDRLRAMYFHACLRYVNREFVTNTSVRERFGIATRNRAQASRLISEAIDEGLISPDNPNAASKLMRYVPGWVKDGNFT